jgi:hypothetical protein
MNFIIFSLNSFYYNIINKQLNYVLKAFQLLYKIKQLCSNFFFAFLNV